MARSQGLQPQTAIMNIIPVLDLMGGIVVHAKMGERRGYRRIESALSRSAKVIDVIEAFINLAPFNSFYIADLDAISGTGNNFSAVVQVKKQFPQISLWVDCGSISECSAIFIEGFGEIVLGSETQETLVRLASNRKALLSLDFLGNTFVGPLEVFDTPILWPRRVIVMTLARVGAGVGPDFERISFVRARAVSRQLYAAGGVRNADDLSRLREIGVDGVLVATALHNGSIQAKDLLLELKY